jgi:RNA polymerase sigma factor (sigma-70 family)
LGAVVSQDDLQLIFEYRQFVMTIFIRHLNFSRDEAEELFQRFVFHLWEQDFKRLRKWRGKTSLSAYLARVARNLAYDYRRELRLEAEAPTEVGGEDPAFANIERRDTLAKALSKLRPREKELIHRRYYLDQTHAEIGEALGMTHGHVSAALTRAKRRLKKILRHL